MATPEMVEATLAGIAGALRTGPEVMVNPLVTQFVTLVVYIDDDGDQRFCAIVPEEQRCHTTLGMLEYAAAIERQRAADHWLKED